MALQKDMTLVDNFGESITFSKCYMRVDSVNTNKINAVAMLGFYKEDKTPLYVSNLYEFMPKIESSNIFEQAYNHIKMLPEFAGSIDC